jgi:hypothetical protein
MVSEDVRFEENLNIFSGVKKYQSIRLKRRDIENANSYLMTSCIKKENSLVDNLGILNSLDGSEIYHLGIIDFLTEYNTTKKVEKTFNNVIHWSDKQGASCQQPSIYADRFIKFLKERL